MAEWTKQEYEVAMQQRDDLFPGFAGEQEEDGEETAENMLNLLCQRNRALAALKAAQIMWRCGDKPRKLDEALTWRENDEKVNLMVDAAIAACKGS